MDGRSGVIVAGGRSVRMGGTEKAVVEIAGVPLIRRVAERLLNATDELVVNCRADQREVIDDALTGVEPRFAIDEAPDRGPVAGIKTGLEAVETEYAAVIATDMPFLNSDIVSYLFERAAGHDAAVPRPSEWFEPLHAVYKARPMVAACDRALERAHPRIIEPLSSLDRVIVDRAELLEHGSLDSFESIDTPDDVRWAETRLT